MLDNILNSCRYVSDNSVYVKINQSTLEKFANQITDIKMEHWLSSSPFGLLELPIETIVNFLLIFESIDFSFWGQPKWTVINNDIKLDGSIALLYVLLKYVKEYNTTGFSNISIEEFKKILKGNIEIPLLEQRYKIIKEISNVVNNKMKGNFYEYIKDITDDITLFNIIQTSFPSFKDERIYNGNKVYLYKLAQLLTSDILHIRGIKEKIKVDYTHLVACADYKIPQVLRDLGILVYNEELSNIVNNKIEIAENSDFEIEIRANTVVVIDRLKKLLNNRFCSIDINDFIFLQKENKNILLNPYHLTRTCNY